jgi:hypothetical protein
MRGNEASAQLRHRSEPPASAPPYRGGAAAVRSGRTIDESGVATPAPSSNAGHNNSLPKQPDTTWPTRPDPLLHGLLDATDLDELLLQEIEHLTAELKEMLARYVSLRSATSVGSSAQAVDQMDQVLERMAAKALDIQIVSRHAILRRQWPGESSDRVAEFNRKSESGKGE